MNDNKGNVELKIARVVRITVIASAVVTFFGLVLYLATGTGGYDGSVFPSSPLLIVQGAALLKPLAVMMVGILILLLTPFFRIGASILIFLKEKDYLYVIISGIVFLVLIVSLILGKVE